MFQCVVCAFPRRGRFVASAEETLIGWEENNVVYSDCFSSDSLETFVWTLQLQQKFQIPKKHVVEIRCNLSPSEQLTLCLQ